MVWSAQDIPRPFWQERLARSWQRAPIVWLTGVRRIGKTTLAKQLEHAEFLNCDLPSTARRVEDPELFFRTLEARTVVFDEIHQLPDPSRILKIAADEYPHLRILATGSSTLAATKKFRDSLTGRKRTVHLLPTLHFELEAFGGAGLDRRLLRGGLPDALLSPDHDRGFYAEWLDSYFARDVQELFNVSKRREFLKLVELLLRSSGGQVNTTQLGKHAQLSRPTVINYLEVLDVTHVVHLLRPYHGGGRQEILRQPKVYGFDTGFVSFVRGWMRLRQEDKGQLWEHLVLETLLSEFEARRIYYWRDKQQREIDFVLERGDDAVDAIECKWQVDHFRTDSLDAFRRNHPRGHNYLLVPATDTPYVERGTTHPFVVTDLEGWSSDRARAVASSLD